MKQPLFKIYTLVLLSTAVLSSGCSGVFDFPKKIWGSSTVDLERGRATAIQKIYHCNVAECFDSVLQLTVIPKEEDLTKVNPDPSQVPSPTKNSNSTDLPGYEPKLGADDPSLPITPPADTYLELFFKKRKQNMLVVMGVPNCVNTTEVGVFFTPVDGGNVKVELTSLSTKAKRNAAEVIFAHLGKTFPEIE